MPTLAGIVIIGMLFSAVSSDSDHMLNPILWDWHDHAGVMHETNHKHASYGMFQHAHAQTAQFSFDTVEANSAPSGITYADEKLWTVNNASDTVYAYTLTGTPIPESTFQVAGATALVGIASDGEKLWLIDRDNIHVRAYTFDGNYIPESSFNTDDVQSGFYLGITYVDGLLYLVDTTTDSVYSYNPNSPEEIESSFELASGNGVPLGITSDGTNLIVTNFGATIFAYSTDGVPNTEFNLQLDRTNGFPTGITFADDKFWVADLNEGKIYSYDVNSTASSFAQFPLNTGNTNPLGITFANERFWVADQQTARIFAYTLDGKHDIESDFALNSPFEISRGLTFADNKLWSIGNDDEKRAIIQSYTNTGDYLSKFSLHPDNKTPTGMTFADGKLYVADLATGIYLYNLDGTQDSQFKPEQQERITGITYYDEKLFAVDPTKFSIYVYTLDGKPLLEETISLGRSTESLLGGMIITDDHFWIINVRTDSIISYDKDGIHDPENDILLDAGNQNPEGIAFADDKLWSVDHDDRRVYVYDTDGSHLADSDFLLATENNFPQGITSDGDLLWVVDDDSHKVFAYSTDGMHDPSAEFVLDSENRNSVGITYADDLLWVIDSHDHHIYAYSTSGVPDNEAGFDLRPGDDSPSGIAFAYDMFWVTDESRTNIIAYHKHGTHDAESEFSLFSTNHDPRGVAFGDDAFWIVDSSDIVYEYQPPLLIYGYVFSDDNGNGMQDPGEDGVETTVTLKEVMHSTHTDSFGEYSFGGIKAGDHTVVVNIPDGYALSGSESAEKTVTVQLHSQVQVNFALESSSITLDVSAFNDTDGDGVRDFNETPFGGLAVLTYTPNTDTVGFVSTDATGTGTTTLPTSSFYAIALPDSGYNVTTNEFTLGTSKYYGVLHVQDPAQDSVHTMEIGLISDMPASLTNVKVGLLAPISGSNSNDGDQNKLATEFGIANFNKRMEDTGRDISLELVIKDNNSLPATALTKIKEFDEEGIDIVIGPLFSATTNEVREYANDNDMLVLSCCSTAPSLAIADNVFRLLPDDNNQGPAIANVALEEGIDVLATIYRNDTWGMGLQDTVEKSYGELGKTFAEPIPYEPPKDETYDYSSAVSSLATTVQQHVNANDVNSVAVLAIGFGEIAEIMKAAASHDILDDVLWIGADGIANSEDIINDSAALRFAQSVNFIAVSPSTPASPITEQVAAHLEDNGHASPNPYVYSSYDAAWLVGNSIARTNSQAASDVIEELPSVAADYIGARGDIMFNDAGDLVPTGYDLFAIRGGMWVNSGFYQDGKITGLLPSTVNVGAMFPQGIRDTAKQNLTGAELGIEDFNKYLKDKNARWQIHVEDRDTRPDSSFKAGHSLTVITELHTEKDIRAVIGPQFSSNTNAIKEYTDENGILVASPSSTATSLSIPNDSIYRITPDDFGQSKALAQLLHERDITTIVIAHRDDIWGQGLRDGVSLEFKMLGGNVHDTIISYAEDTMNYAETVKRLNDEVLRALSTTSGNVAVMYIGFNEIVEVMKLASDPANPALGKVLWFGTDGNHTSPSIVDTETTTQVADFATDVMFTALQVTFASEPERLDSVKERILERLGITDTPNTYAYSSYEAAWLVGLAIEEAGTAESPAILDKFEDAVDARNKMDQSIIGQIVLNENGDLATSDYAISQIIDQIWVRIGTYSGSSNSISFTP